jgi:hypothetical protein
VQPGEPADGLGGLGRRKERGAVLGHEIELRATRAREGVEGQQVDAAEARKCPLRHGFDYQRLPSIPYGIAGINLEIPPCQRPEEVL